MRPVFLFSIIFLASTFCALAQTLEQITAKEIFPIVQQKAFSELAPDSYPTAVIFLAMEYQGVPIVLDKNGKASGWIYRFYSPSKDSVLYFAGVKITLFGTQVFSIQTDSISQYMPLNIGTTGLEDPWVDSPEALTGSLNGGAETFLQSNPEAKISLALLVNNPTLNPVMPKGEFWYFRYSSSVDTLTCLVWGWSGQPLRCGSSNAPKITTFPNTIARVGDLFTYDVEANGSPAPLFSLTKNPTGMKIDPVQGKISWIPDTTQIGLHDVIVRAENIHGIDEQPFQILVQPVNAPPHIVSKPLTEVNAGDVYMYQLLATGSPAPTFHLVNPPAGMVVDSGRGILVWTPSRQQTGSHEINILARNDAGEDTQSFQLTVYSAPKFQPVPAQVAYTQTLFSLTVDADGFPAPTYNLVGAPAGMTIYVNSGLLEWTPGDSDVGVCTVYVEAKNRAGSQQISFTIQVEKATAIDDPHKVPMHSSLEVYPNPVLYGEKIIIPFVTSQPLQYRVSIIDVNGRIVKEISHGIVPSGRHEVTQDTGGLDTGVYMILLETGHMTLSKSVVVIR